MVMKFQILIMIKKMGSTHACLAVTSLASAFKKDENYYLQVFLRV